MTELTEEPWASGDFDGNETKLRDIEWSKMSLEFTNAGYREGITAGKEAFLQSGFDSGFAEIGVPIGRDLGLLRGTATALLTFLSTCPTDQDHLVSEVREIDFRLSTMLLSDIAPRDEQADLHVREHDLYEQDVGIGENGKMEDLVDKLAKLGTGSSNLQISKMEEIRRSKEALGTVSTQLGLGPIPLGLSQSDEVTHV